METLFENSYVSNKEIAKEIYRYFYFQRRFIVVCHFLLAFSFLVNLIMAILGKSYSWVVFIFAPLLVLYRVFCYFHQVNTMVKREREVHGEQLGVQILVTDDYIQNTASNGAVNRLEYGNIRSAVRTKNLILLRTKANLIYIFRKDAFTIGTEDEFIAFLRKKGIKGS